MTREETVKELLTELIDMIDNGSQRDLDRADEIGTSIIKLFEQKPCDDAISRDAVLNAICDYVALGEFADKSHTFTVRPLEKRIDDLPSVTQKSKIGHCKECKYFEYDSVAKVDGVPLIVAHEICSKWGDGCKTKEDGYCFLFEPQESEE